MIDKQELFEYVSKQLNRTDLIYSEQCVNPTEGFTKDYKRGTLVPNRLGYWVTSK